MQKEHSFTISNEEDGLRLDRILSLKFPGVKRSDWQNRIQRGDVWINTRSNPRSSTRVKAGEEVTFRFIRKEEPPVNRSAEILYRDDSLLVVNKPPDLPVHPTGLYFKNTLSELLKEMLSTAETPFRPRPVHRIDRETSGLILFAETTESARLLNRQFLSGQVDKQYLVIVEGDFPEYLDANGYIGRQPGSEIKKYKVFTEQKPDYMHQTARTEFWKVSGNKKISLVRAKLHTGRTHQIRATLKSSGFPVTGDRLYGIDPLLYLKFIQGKKSVEDLNVLRIPRTALHSYRMTLKHPKTGKTIEFEASLPDDMQSVLNSA